MRVPWTNFGSEARGNLKLHEPCEVLARVWKAQNSLRLLPWIYSVLRLKYAEPSKFTVLKIDFEGAKKLQQKNFILWRSKETPTEKFHFVKEQRNSNRKISFCEGAKKLQQKNFILWRSKETPTEKFHFVKEQRNSNTEIFFCKGAKKLQYTNFELNRILFHSEARERVKDTLPHKFSIVITSVITKSQ